MERMVNLAQATPAELMAAFTQDATAFLAVFERSLREASSAAETLQALGHAGEALRGIRIGAEFLGLDAMSALCRQGEQELLRQLPQIGGGRPVQWALLEQVVAGLRRQLRAASAPALPERAKPPMQAGGAQGRKVAQSPASASGERPHAPGAALPAQPPAPDADAPRPAEGVENAAPQPARSGKPDATLPGPAEPVAPSEPSLASAPDLAPQPRLAVEANVTAGPPPPPAGPAMLALGEPLLQRLSEIPDLLREQIESWRSLREALEADRLARAPANGALEPPRPDTAGAPAGEPAAPQGDASETAPGITPAAPLRDDDMPAAPGESGPAVAEHAQPWNARIEVRLARLGNWLLALPATKVLGLVPRDGQDWQLPRGDRLLLTEEGAVPVLTLCGDWGGPAEAEGCSLLLQHGGRFFALRVDACLPARTLHFWSIPPQIGGRHGIEAAAVLPRQSGHDMALLLALPSLAGMLGAAEECRGP
ncbi:hypothetical protein GALL_284220 [mine drainage metagenome]|uniref:HPt domain-containing protein n=1 Tax=mine drainage metagenome TaxID=410659 RepID=A0A1J5RJG4_9ZZZZ